MNEKITVDMIVANHFGVLSRIAAVYAKRGHNVDSFFSKAMGNPAYSQVTIVSAGNEYMKNQIVRQLEKLHDVKVVVLREGDQPVMADRFFFEK